MKKATTSLYRDGDGREMKFAIKTLVELDVCITRPSPYQLKIGDINYYPSTGRITLDPAIVHDGRGLDALLDLLEERQNRVGLELSDALFDEEQI
jgi:hypothetical protein